METIHHIEIIINIFLQSLGSWLVVHFEPTYPIYR